MVKYAILGPVELCDGERRVAVSGPRQAALLALLLLNANRALSTDRLIDALWDGLRPTGARKRLQAAILRLRRTLDGDGDGAVGESVLRTVTGGGYLLAVAQGELDAELFEACVEEGRRTLDAGEVACAREVLGEALGMWRGPALGALGYEEFAQPEIRRLEELRLTALEARVDCDLQLGAHGGLIAELEALVGAHAGRERLVEQLMVALYRCGRQGEALQAYTRTRTYLSEELGLEPGPALRTLQRAILEQAPSLGLQWPAATEPAASARESQPTAPVLPTEPAPTGQATLAPAAGCGRRVRFRLPLAVSYFVGREAELDGIDAALGVSGRAVVTQAITGLGGVGKSQLAARYVREHVDAYEVVAWIRAEDGGIADLSEFAVELGLAVAQLTPAQRAASAVRWLSGCEQRWLLVLDNVAGPQQLRDCCPSSGNGRVIVTTRDRAMAQFGPALAVDVFDEPTAVSYLLARAGRGEDRDGAVRLARALGFLPLALSHAGAYCAAGTSFDDYLQLLRALPATELFDDHPEVSYEQTVASTWQVSIRAAEREAPLARRVLAMAAFLAPDAIPRELFDVLLDDPGTAGARKCLLDALNALHRLSLAQVDDATVSVHRLLQKTIRDDPVARADDTAPDSALAAVAAAFPRDVHQPQAWPQCERLLPHALAISAAHPTPGEMGPRLVTLLNTAAQYLLRADPRARAVDTATRARAQAHKLLGPQHPETLRAGVTLADSYREVGRIAEAVELGEQVLADSKRILGPEHPDTLRASVVLALSYWNAGRIAEAIEVGEQVLADSKRILGPEHPVTLRAGALLALSYAQAGRTSEAIEVGEQVLADSEQILGPEHPATLRAGTILAFSYAQAGRTSEAIEVGEQVLADSEQILGPEHPATLRAGTILAFSYAQAGRTSEAIKLGEQVLTDNKRILGLKHPATLRAGTILAFSYMQAGRTSEAIKLGEQVLTDNKRILGLKHPGTLRAGTILAFSYMQAGRTSEAIKLGEQVLTDSKRILGLEHPATVMTSVLANAYRES